MKFNYRDFFNYKDESLAIKEELLKLNEMELLLYPELDYNNPEQSKNLTDDQKIAFNELLLAIMALKETGKKRTEITKIIDQKRKQTQSNLINNLPIEYLDVNGNKYRMDFGVSKDRIDYSVSFLINDYTKIIGKDMGHFSGDVVNFLHNTAQEIVDSNLELFNSGKKHKDIAIELNGLFLNKIKQKYPYLKIDRTTSYPYLIRHFPKNKISNLNKKIDSIEQIAAIQMYWPHIQRDTNMPLVDEQGNTKIFDGWSKKSGEEGIPNPNNKISVVNLVSVLGKSNDFAIRNLLKNMINKNPQLNLQMNRNSDFLTLQTRDTSGTRTNRNTSIDLGDLKNNFNTMIRNLRNAHDIR